MTTWEMKKWGIVALASVVIVGAFTLFKVMQIRAAIAEFENLPEQSASVEDFVAERVHYAPTISVIGEIVSPQRLELRNEIAGEVTAVNVQSGARIRQGQVLVQIDTGVDAANLEAARARAELARSVYKRSEKLHESKVDSRDQLDRAISDLATSQAQIEALEHSIDKKTLRSPFDGRAGLHDLEVGQYLAENTRVTTLVGDTDFMWLDFKVAQFYPQLPVGTSVSVQAVTASADKVSSTASIVAENTVLTAANRSRMYRARIANNDGYWSANTMVSVRVPTGRPQPMIKIPATAVQHDPLGKYIFLLTPDTGGNGYRAKRRQVNVRQEDGEYALIDKGLQEGERVAAAGAFKLREGLLVHTNTRRVLTPTLDGEPVAGTAGQETQ